MENGQSPLNVEGNELYVWNPLKTLISQTACKSCPREVTAQEEATTAPQITKHKLVSQEAAKSQRTQTTM